MPASPVNFSFDAATTVVPRGKLEVYVKRGNGLPIGWALDENGHDSNEPDRVLSNIINKTGGGILPLGGSGELTSGYKGYGFAMLCEIATAILSGGTTSKYLDGVRNSAKADGQDRIFIHGEKEAEARGRVLSEGVYLNDKTYAEMQMIAEYTGTTKYLPSYID